MLATGGFLQLKRNILTADWYRDVPVKSLFLHLMMTAAFKARKIGKIILSRGQLLKSYRDLEYETGLTRKQIRRAVSQLQEYGEIKKLITKFGTIYELVNYEEYQGTPQGTLETEDVKHTLTLDTTGFEACGQLSEKEHKKHSQGTLGTPQGTLQGTPQGTPKTEDTEPTQPLDTTDFEALQEITEKEERTEGRAPCRASFYYNNNNNIINKKNLKASASVVDSTCENEEKEKEEEENKHQPEIELSFDENLKTIINEWNTLGGKIKTITVQDVMSSTKLLNKIRYLFEKLPLNVIILNIKRIKEIPGLLGYNDKNWIPSFGWIFKFENFKNLMSGEYDNWNTYKYMKKESEKNVENVENIYQKREELSEVSRSYTEFEFGETELCGDTGEGEYPKPDEISGEERFDEYTEHEEEWQKRYDSYDPFDKHREDELLERMWGNIARQYPLDYAGKWERNPNI